MMFVLPVELPMPVPDMEEVRQLLREFEPRIRAVIERAWQEWLDFPGKSKLMFPGRFRATFVFDAIARNAILEFTGDKNIHVSVERQTVKFLFKDQVFTRFKKGNSKGVGSNIETQAVLDFIDPMRTIPGLLPEIMRVEFCYAIDQLGLSLSDVAVVARDRNRRLWAYSIPAAQPSAGVIPFPPPKPDLTPPTVFQKKPAADEESNKSE